MATTRGSQDNRQGTLYLAFELGQGGWKLGFSTGLGQKARERDINARHVAGVLEEITLAKRRFKLRSRARVVSCYEAGRDGFWLHRFLEQHGVENLVVDSASIEVNRRARRAKTDRMDVHKLLSQLIRYDAGERKVWGVVQVPSPEEEDRRQLHRELQTAKRDRTRVTNRIKGLLANQGLVADLKGEWLMRLDSRRLWDGSRLRPELRARLAREWRKVEVLNEEIRELQTERKERVKAAADRPSRQVKQLFELKGIGLNSAWLYVMELFGWRRFRNRRELGSLAGLTPTPHRSGTLQRERGISKAGNRHVRSMAIEIAWCWVRFQPQSALTRWYQRRFGGGGSRLRRIGIVALARRLLIDLWRYLETGALPDGAELKPQLRY